MQVFKIQVELLKAVAHPTRLVQMLGEARSLLARSGVGQS